MNWFESLGVPLKNVFLKNLGISGQARFFGCVFQVVFFF